VSGDVSLEGADKESEQALEYLDDVTVEYELTETGDLELVGFRKNDFDALSQGDFTKTGIGVIWQKDFDTFKELFGKDKSRKDK
jgi:hypothetical protein